MPSFNKTTLLCSSYYASTSYHFDLKILNEDALALYKELVSNLESERGGSALYISKTLVKIMEINFSLGQYLSEVKKQKAAHQKLKKDLHILWTTLLSNRELFMQVDNVAEFCDKASLYIYIKSISKYTDEMNIDVNDCNLITNLNKEIKK